jgi:hypothetical protein
MKTTVAFLACSVALTLVFYMLDVYLLPGPPPSAAMVVLFAGVAMVLVWLARSAIQGIRNSRAKKNNAHKAVLFAAALTGLALLVSACHKASPPPLRLHPLRRLRLRRLHRRRQRQGKSLPAREAQRCRA